MQPLANLFEMRSESRVRRKVDRSCWCFNPVAAPKRFVSIVNTAGGKVLSGNASDGPTDIPPVHLLFGSHSLTGQKAAHAEWHDDSRLVSPCEAPECGQVEVIVMVVAQQHNVDLR